jgi:hypothetical protein
LTRSRPSGKQGAREPQLKVSPDYVSTSGPEAIELARAAGLKLDPWQDDILVDGLGEQADGDWAAQEVADVVPRQNGKGSVFEARELAGLILFGEKLIIHTAHEVKTAMEAFRRVTELFTNIDDLRRRVKKVSHQNGEEGIELLTGQRLRFLARSKGSGRGFTCDCLIWDEAYALTDVIVDAQLPMLSAIANHQIWYGSSPPLNSVDGAVLMRLRKRAQLIARTGAIDSLVFYDWGRQDFDLSMLKELQRLGELDLDDIDLAYTANPAMPHRVTERTVRKERKALSDEGYARERLCIWPKDLAADYQLISEENWAARRDPESRITGDYVLSCAVSVDRKRGAICAAGYRSDYTAHVEVTSNAFVVDARPGTAWIPGRLAEIAAKRKPRVIVIDAGAPQGSLIGDCERLKLEITKMVAGEVAQGYGMFFDGVQGEDEAGRDVWHLGQPELTDSVAGAITRQMGPAGTTWDARNALTDITPLRAASDALYGLKKYGHKGPPVLVGSLLANED